MAAYNPFAGSTENVLVVSNTNEKFRLMKVGTTIPFHDAAGITRGEGEIVQARYSADGTVASIRMKLYELSPWIDVVVEDEAAK